MPNLRVHSSTRHMNLIKLIDGFDFLRRQNITDILSVICHWNYGKKKKTLGSQTPCDKAKKCFGCKIKLEVELKSLSDILSDSLASGSHDIISRVIGINKGLCVIPGSDVWRRLVSTLRMNDYGALWRQSVGEPHSPTAASSSTYFAWIGEAPAEKTPTRLNIETNHHTF